MTGDIFTVYNLVLTTTVTRNWNASGVAHIVRMGLFVFRPCHSDHKGTDSTFCPHSTPDRLAVILCFIVINACEVQPMLWDLYVAYSP